MTTEERIAQVIWGFDFGNYGMPDVEIGILEDPEAQEWIADLAKEIAEALRNAG